MNQKTTILHKMGLRLWLWLGVAALLISYGLSHHFDMLNWPSQDVFISILDPDVYLRLTKVRELLQDGNIYNHAVIATNAPYGGVDTPWTRPLDFILVTLYQFTPSDFSAEKRLLLVSVWYPLMIGVMIIFFALKAAETNFRSSAKFVTLALCLAGYLWNTPSAEYFRPGNADHHSLQALLWCISLWLVLEKHTVRRAAGLGMALGLWTWVSPESAVYVFAVLVVTGFAVLKKPAMAYFPLVASLFLTLMTVISVFVEIPADRILTSDYFDTMSIVYVTLFSFCTIGFFILYAFISRMKTEKRRFHSSIAAAIVLGLGFLAIFPKFVKGPMADVDPYMVTNFLTRIWEATPMLSTGPSIYLPILYLPVLALLLSIRFFKTEPYLLPLLFIALAINFLQLRGYYYLEILSFIIIARLLPPYLLAVRRKYHLNKYLYNPLTLLLVLHLLVAGALTLIPKSSHFANDAINHCNSLGFQTVQNGALVKALGSDQLIMESNIMGNSGVAFFTPYHYVAGFYHREGQGYQARDKILESSDIEAIRPILKERQVKALYICPSTIKDSWVNQYFGDKPVPEVDWIKINDKVEFPPAHNQSSKPLLLMVEP